MTSNNRSELLFHIRTSFSVEGRVLLDGIYSDVPATVVVSYRGQTVLEQRVPLQPGDGAHRIELPPLPDFVPLRGVVLDASGAPLAGVLVRSSAGEQSAGRTESNEKGEFDLGVVGVGATMGLGFSKTGYGRHQLEFTGRAGDAQSVGAVTLGTGRDLLVQLMAEEGVLFVPLAGTLGVGVRPALTFFDETVEPVRQGEMPGEWRFQDLPQGQLHFVLRSLHGHELEAFTSSAPEAIVVWRLSAETLEYLRSTE